MTGGNLFGLKPKAKPAKKAAVPDAAVQEMIALWVRLFEAKHGERPIVTGKDGAAIKRLLAHATCGKMLKTGTGSTTCRLRSDHVGMCTETYVGLQGPSDLVKRRLEAYLVLDDPYIAGQGHPLALMLGAWNRLVALDLPERSKVPDAGRTEALLRRLKGGAS